MTDPANSRPRILIVDDVHENLHALMNILRDEYAIAAATHGEKALELAQRQPQPDLILLDAMMPKISGFDVLDILRNTPETANVRIIMLTALSQPKDRERAEGLGVDEYMVKSQVVIGDVVARVKHHLGLTA